MVAFKSRSNTAIVKISPGAFVQVRSCWFSKLKEGERKFEVQETISIQTRSCLYMYFHPIPKGAHIIYKHNETVQDQMMNIQLKIFAALFI